MNKEVIKKYKKEFDHWLEGGEVLLLTLEHEWVLKVNTHWDYPGPYIINDKYSEFRKALAEDKTIQYNPFHALHNRWDDATEPDFCYPVQKYRIKPDEPQFKIGDWVRLTVFDKTIHRIERLTYDQRLKCYHPKLSNFRGNISSTEDIELWEPQPSEWCVIPNPESGYIVGRYKVDICTAREAKNIMPLEFLQTLKEK